MKKKLLLFALSLVLLAGLKVPSYGWSDTGHMTVAYVAYLNMSPPARARANALVRLNPLYNIWLSKIPAGTSASKRDGMLFMIAATWPDQIKGDGQHESDGPENGDRPPNSTSAGLITGYSDMALHKYWHFVDLPFSSDNTPLEDPPVPNAGTQIPALRAALSSNSPDALKSYALVWLLHLVGDVHQPLHCTSRFTANQPKGDAGGNFVTVCDPQCGRRLHSFWDGILGTSSDPEAAIKVGQSLAPPSATEANNLDSSAWINESFTFAKSVVYAKQLGHGPFFITPAYREAARTLAMRRVSVAGVRLAKILSTELK